MLLEDALKEYLYDCQLRRIHFLILVRKSVISI